MLQPPRLHLRELTSADLDYIHELHSLPETDEFNTSGIPESIEITKNLLESWLAEQRKHSRDAYVYAIYLEDDEKFIGLIGLKMGKEKYKTAEAWLKLHKDHWRKGYAIEASIQLMHFAFNKLNLHRVEAGCASENIASARVMEKAGMTREGIMRKKMPIRGEWKDNYFYAILEEDFRHNESKFQNSAFS